MKAFARFFLHVARQIAGATLAFGLVMLWVGLVLLLIVQLYIATRHEFNVPGFVLRRLEARIQESGFNVTFDRASFDPTGRILVQAPRVFLPGFAEPVVTARAAYIGLSPWPVLVGRFDANEIRVLDGALHIPAILSPSGRAEPLVHDVDALIVPGTRETLLRHISGRLRGVTISASGGVTHRTAAQQRPRELAEFIRARFPDFCRGAIALGRELEAFDQPSLHLELTPAATRGALVAADLVALGFKRETPLRIELKRLHATTRFHVPLDAAMITRLHVMAEELRLPGGIEVNGVSASLRAQVRPPTAGGIAATAPGRNLASLVHLGDAQLYAKSVRTPDGAAEAVSVTASPRTLARWDAVSVGRFVGSELGIAGELDFAEGNAQLRFAGPISPAVLATISGRVKTDVRQYFDFREIDCHAADAEFGPKWRFRRLGAQVSVRGINAYGVKMDEGYATVELDPKRFYSPRAYGRIGENHATGSYEHVFGTHEFRFLLDGRLRPLDIGAWFHSWWDNFFKRFSFPVAPPDASVDVHGFWADGRRTYVFVFADAKAPVALGQQIEHVRTRLFIRPGFFDGLELFGTERTGGRVRGTFTVRTDAESGDWRSIDFAGQSNVPLAFASGLGGKLSEPLFAPFEVAGRPVVQLSGHLDGPATSGTRHQQLDLDVRSEGAFKFHQLPFEAVAFALRLRDEEMTVDVKEARFAGGRVRLHSKVWGVGPGRRLGFDAMLDDASLGVAVASLQHSAALRKGMPSPGAGKFVQEKANVRVDVAVSAEGLYGNPLSFHGGGNASLRGPEIGEVPLFGPLSELLKFTALRFTTAVGRFKIDGPKLDFPEVSVRGANSAMDAHGEYALDRKQLDFRVKVFPFQESGNVIKSVVGAVLTPISNALEVKLTGTLEKPDWAFVMGPTNILRTLAEDGTPEPGPVPPAEASVPAQPKPKD